MCDFEIQQKVIDAVNRFHDKTGLCPTVGEISKITKIPTNTVVDVTYEVPGLWCNDNVEDDSIALIESYDIR